METETSREQLTWSRIPSRRQSFQMLATANNMIGISSWRKFCLYGFIMGFLFMVTLNFALTLWVLRSLNFLPVRFDLNM